MPAYRFPRNGSAYGELRGGGRSANAQSGRGQYLTGRAGRISRASSADGISPYPHRLAPHLHWQQLSAPHTIVSSCSAPLHCAACSILTTGDAGEEDRRHYASRIRVSMAPSSICPASNHLYNVKTKNTFWRYLLRQTPATHCLPFAILRVVWRTCAYLGRRHRIDVLAYRYSICKTTGGADARTCHGGLQRIAALPLRRNYHGRTNAFAVATGAVLSQKCYTRLGVSTMPPLYKLWHHTLWWKTCALH